MRSARAGRRAEKADRMAAQRQPDMAVVLDHLAAGRHRPQRHRRLADFRERSRASRAEAAANSGSGSSRSALIAHSASRRASFSEGCKASASASCTSDADRNAGAPPEIVDRGEGLDRPARRRWRRRRHWRGRAPCASPSRTAKRSSPVGRLQRAVPARGVDADRADLDAMVARVAHDLGRRVEAHRLGVEQRRAEHVRMMAFEPGGGIGDQREGGRVAFREAVAAEALELAEGLLGEIPLIARWRPCRRPACPGISRRRR